MLHFSLHRFIHTPREVQIAARFIYLLCLWFSGCLFCLDYLDACGDAAACLINCCWLLQTSWPLPSVLFRSVEAESKLHSIDRSCEPADLPPSLRLRFVLGWWLVLFWVISDIRYWVILKCFERLCYTCPCWDATAPFMFLLTWFLLKRKKVILKKEVLD